VTLRRFPYESTPAKFWMHTLRVITQPANPVESAHPDTFQGDIWWTGNNPYHDVGLLGSAALEDWFARSHPEQAAAFCQRQIDDWYTTVARVQEQPAPLLFAEKHMWPNYLPVLLWELYPRAKEVFLVRDFRDMARSIEAFDERRGFAGFGRQDGASDETYMRGELHRMVRDLRRSWQSRGDRAHLVRYEDLVADTEGTVRGLLEYLEVESAPEAVSTSVRHGAESISTLPGSVHEPAEVSSHRTASDLEASVGRWRSEADDSFRELSEEVFGDALREFGYES